MTRNYSQLSFGEPFFAEAEGITANEIAQVDVSENQFQIIYENIECTCTRVGNLFLIGSTFVITEREARIARVRYLKRQP